MIIPTVVLFLSMEFVIGSIALLVIFVLVGHHFGIKHDIYENEFIVYSGYERLHKVKRKIKISSITSYEKSAKKIISSYSLPVNSYSTTVKSYRLDLEINNKSKITLLTGTEKAIDKIIEIIEKNMSKL